MNISHPSPGHAMRPCGLALLAVLLCSCATARDTQKIGKVDIAAWRGFNLMEKCAVDWLKNAPYREEDFRLIAEFGFNFVRLPLDYRCYTATNDWLAFREDILREI